MERVERGKRTESGYRTPITLPDAGRSLDSGLAGHRGVLVVAGVLAGLILAWTLADFFFDRLEFEVTVEPWFRGDEELAAGVIRFFGALVLFMFPDDNEVGTRLRWVASGFFILGLGYLAFGYVEPLVLEVSATFNEELYEEIFVRSAAAVLFLVALVPETPPRFRGWLAVSVVLLVAALVTILKLPVELPLLVDAANLERAGVRGAASPGWLTPWHWVLSAIPFVLAVAAAAAAVLRYRSGILRGWLLIAMVLWTGSLANEYLYPAGYYNQVLTTTGVLHAAFGVVVAVGGVFELRRIAAERAALLATERDRSRRMGELATLRADFSDMVAHELGSPLSAIRRLTEMLQIENLDPGARASALTIIGSEVDNLDTLVKDVRAAAERDRFEVTLRPVPLGTLLANARALAGTLPADHRLDVVLDDAVRDHEPVLADPERIGQVLRNLLSNAAKYSPAGAPVELRVRRVRRHVLMQVADYGPGIHPDDLPLIFEKYGRGREGRKTTGVGLGLYLSSRILQSHGSALTVNSRLGEGAVFGFELEVAR